MKILCKLPRLCAVFFRHFRQFSTTAFVVLSLLLRISTISAEVLHYPAAPFLWNPKIVIRNRFSPPLEAILGISSEFSPPPGVFGICPGLCIPANAGCPLPILTIFTSNNPHSFSIFWIDLQGCLGYNISINFKQFLNPTLFK